MKSEEHLYTVKETARKLRKSPKTIANLLSSRQMTFVQGRPALIPASSIKEYLQKRLKRARV